MHADDGLLMHTTAEEIDALDHGTRWCPLGQRVTAAGLLWRYQGIDHEVIRRDGGWLWRVSIAPRFCPPGSGGCYSTGWKGPLDCERDAVDAANKWRHSHLCCLGERKV